jgi:uncharacterized glyoxalase superfamily protein PhnB
MRKFTCWRMSSKATDNPPPLSAPDYGRSLRGVGFNLIVRDVRGAIAFAETVLHATAYHKTDAFAAMKLHGADFMFHDDTTYAQNPLKGFIAGNTPRGAGVELRIYGLDPDEAEKRARAAGYTVLAGTIDKPHGLRECMIVDNEGYVWIPSAHLPKQE